MEGKSCVWLIRKPRGAPLAVREGLCEEKTRREERRAAFHLAESGRRRARRCEPEPGNFQRGRRHMVLLPRAISDWDALPRAAVASPSLDVSESGPGARWEENQDIGVRVVRQPWPGGQRRARLVLPALPSPPCKLQMFDDRSSTRLAGCRIGLCCFAPSSGRLRFPNGALIPCGEGKGRAPCALPLAFHMPFCRACRRSPVQGVLTNRGEFSSKALGIFICLGNGAFTHAVFLARLHF